jgi:hypothetical protein
MNTRFRGITTAALALLLSGCLDDEYKVTTVISTDGTCERVITVGREKKTLPNGAFPVPTDSTWQCEWTLAKKVDSTSKKADNVYTARKRFADFDALAREYPVQHDSTRFSISVKVQKRFRWFYSYYDYTETYARFDPLHVPVQPSAFMTEEELRQFMSSEVPDSTLETKWNRWEQQNMMEWAFGLLVDAVRRRNDPGLPVSLFEQNKDRLIALFADDTTKGSQHQDFADKTVSDMAGLLHLSADAVRLLVPDLDSIKSQALKRMETTDKAKGSYTNSVVMPGVIIATNAGEVRGTTVVWRFTHEHLALMDYPMNVESRVVNLWAIILTAFVVLVAVGLPLFLRRSSIV